MAQLNTFSDVSSIAQAMQENAIFAIHEMQVMGGLVRSFGDMGGLNDRKGYDYNKGTAAVIGEDDDLTSSAFTPSLRVTLTPFEIGLQYFVTDSRRDSDLPENIIRDGSMELAMAANDKIETDLVGDMASFTAGTVGAAGTTITWSYMANAIAIARNASKSISVPLNAVIHGYQASVLAKSASIAGATLAQAPNTTEEVTRRGLTPAFRFHDCLIYQTFVAPDTLDDFKGGVFPRDALAIDWRRRVRVEPDRDPSRRGTEFNMSAVYAHGVWRPSLGVTLHFDASTPSGA